MNIDDDVLALLVMAVAGYFIYRAIANAANNAVTGAEDAVGNAIQSITDGINNTVKNTEKSVGDSVNAMWNYINPDFPALPPDVLSMAQFAVPAGDPAYEGVVPGL